MTTTTSQTEHYLELFENAIDKHINNVGKEKGYGDARKAGLGISPDGHIVSCVGHPALVLLRLIKIFTATNQMNTISECMPLIDEMENLKDRLGCE